MSASEDFCGCGDADCCYCFGGASDEEKPVSGNAWLDEMLEKRAALASRASPQEEQNG